MEEVAVDAQRHSFSYQQTSASLVLFKQHIMRLQPSRGQSGQQLYCLAVTARLLSSLTSCLYNGDDSSTHLWPMWELDSIEEQEIFLSFSSSGWPEIDLTWDRRKPNKILLNMHTWERPRTTEKLAKMVKASPWIPSTTKEKKEDVRGWGLIYGRLPGKAQKTRARLLYRFKSLPSPLTKSRDLVIFLYLVHWGRHPYKWRFSLQMYTKVFRTIQK